MQAAMSTILVIDDDEMALNAFRYLLHGEGYDVLETAEGPQGVELYREREPDLVLLDLGLPSMNGLDVLREIRQIDETAAVILVTGYVTDQVEGEALQLGATAVLEKGPALDNLAKTIEEAIELRRGRQNGIAPRS